MSCQGATGCAEDDWPGLRAIVPGFLPLLLATLDLSSSRRHEIDVERPRCAFKATGPLPSDALERAVTSLLGGARKWARSARDRLKAPAPALRPSLVPSSAPWGTEAPKKIWSISPRTSRAGLTCSMPSRSLSRRPLADRNSPWSGSAATIASARRHARLWTVENMVGIDQNAAERQRAAMLAQARAALDEMRSKKRRRRIFKGGVRTQLSQR